jgi:3'-5' exoribonuclease
MTFEQAEEVFENALDHLSEPLQGLCFEIVADLNFREGYGAKKHHHNFKGGLFVHTAEVVDNCMMAETPAVNMQVLITAAIWHDYLKILEYAADEKGEPQYTDFKRRVGHIAGSFAEFAASATDAGVDGNIIREVSHCILSHHGRAEWGSAITPQTPEALTLHWADCMSAFFENETYKEKEP